MVSEIFKEVEDRIANAFFLQNDLTQEIARKLNKNKTDIERAIYASCIATGARAMDAALTVNEFLVALKEVEIPQGTKEQEL